MNTQSSQSQEEREIRVFVSSTFRDMQEDRDYLVKHIFPQLRRLCEARGVTWGEVDLRWGITEEEAAEGQVLPLCLEEIRRGLSESELLDLLGSDEAPLPQATWTPFYLTVEAALARRSGLLQFFHDYIRDAAGTHYLSTEQQRKSCHRTLADYFRHQSKMTDRNLDELPWQLQQSGEWDRLKDLLTQMHVFLRLRTVERWKQVSAALRAVPETALRSVQRLPAGARRLGSRSGPTRHLCQKHQRVGAVPSRKS